MILSYSAIALWSVGLMTGWWLSLLLRERTSSPSRLPLPPGPRGYPVIGNLLDMPTYKPWEVFDKWFKIYGDMVFFELLGQPFLLLGSAERAHDIFEKLSSNYSGRPRLPMFNEVMYYNWETAFLPYGWEWKGHRRLLHQLFNVNTVHNYYPVQVTATRAFLRRLLKSPDDFALHIRYTFTSTVLKLIYGLDVVEGDNSNLIEISEAVVAAVAEAGKPGAFLVDFFPWMKFIPAWFPGAGWKRKALYWRRIGQSLVQIPWNKVKEQLQEGRAQPSIAASIIEELKDQTSPDFTDEERLARNTCAAALAGGADTAVSTILSFFMALVLYPQVQQKAQEELDGVLGNRLPEFNDRPNLPYVNAMVKEALRWQVVAPLAAPHTAMEADEYSGYHIPKGTILIGNSWSILHDPEAYKDPFVYNPDRFMKNGKIDCTVRDPMVATFGYGRRICPGRFFAENSLFILICHLLTVFDIRPGLGDDGEELEIKPEMTDGLVSYPVPFACRITPRSEKAGTLIRNSGLVD